MKETDWKISIARWIIEDGNYPDFKKGAVVEFALDFGNQDLVLSETNTPSCEEVIGDEGVYQVNAPILHWRQGESGEWVIDVGILAYNTDIPPANATVGSFVTGQTSLGVCCYDYREYRYKSIQKPMIYRWQIERIREQWPKVSLAQLGGKAFWRKDNWDMVDVETTDAFDPRHDKLGYIVSWLMDCRLVVPEARMPHFRETQESWIAKKSV